MQTGILLGKDFGDFPLRGEEEDHCHVPARYQPLFPPSPVIDPFNF